MSSNENDLTQNLIAECRRKDELLDAYREKVQILEYLIEAKDRRIKVSDDHADDLKRMLKESMAQTDRAIGIVNTVLP